MRNSLSGTIGLIAGLGALSAAAAPPPPTVYEFAGATLVVLETADRESWANGVNKHGEVVGAYMAFEDQKRPFFHNGTLVAIAGGTGTHDGEAFDINNASEVVGEAEEAIENDALRAFYWKPGQPFEFLDNDPYSQDQIGYDWQTWARGISDDGEIVGGAARLPATWQPPPPQYCYATLAVRWASRNADPASIHCSPGAFPYTARDVNSAGTIVVTDYGLTSTDMYRWKSGTYQTIPAPPDIPDYYKGSWGTVWGVNHLHHVIGDYQYEYVMQGLVPARRAFIWDGVAAQSKLLGVLPGGRRSFGRDLNSSGVAVGGAEKPHAYLRDVYHQVAYVWHKDFGMKPLPTMTTPFGVAPGECMAEAVSNTSDEGITYAAGYCKSGGKKHAVRWDIQIVAKSPGSSSLGSLSP